MAAEIRNSFKIRWIEYFVIIEGTACLEGYPWAGFKNPFADVPIGNKTDTELVEPIFNV